MTDRSKSTAPLYGEQTQLALQNFTLSGETLPRPFLRALGWIKSAAAWANGELGLLPAEHAQWIARSALQVANGDWDAQFPLDVFQTGSGTSTNMNANEVIATLASREMDDTVHPNDHVNMGQSSNDVIPSAIHLSAAIELQQRVIPAVHGLAGQLEALARQYQDVIKTGRTHLMDAMPISLGQEFSAWAAQLHAGIARLQAVTPRLHQLALGGTAVGTGINAHPEFAHLACQRLSELSGLDITPHPNPFVAISAQDTAVELSGQLNTLAVTLMKLCNDLRWMNSGPNSGLGELQLHKLQAGSSIMPGKVNPVIPEAVAMVCAQVMGNHCTMTVAGQSGNFQLNVMLPLMAANLLRSMHLLANGCEHLQVKALADITVNREALSHQVNLNPMLVTALNRRIGYDQAARIAQQAMAEGRPIIEVAEAMTDLSSEELRGLLDPRHLAYPHQEKD
ncbi:class II fumarate hydratase [Aestuariibacter halophilus]|uniref:Fumarate hydratase class II n=1 Tax=Fluctibacter halophilus TaxID=226011 RepID=A0ABS8G7G5_9ALTE|nr:class II fumarate hydratase [Aestuariibacter halophilus]MCC2616368.1 class II fumarate hydratase [Aestuariibacter halophilus]